MTSIRRPVAIIPAGVVQKEPSSQNHRKRCRGGTPAENETVTDLATKLIKATPFYPTEEDPRIQAPRLMLLAICAVGGGQVLDPEKRLRLIELFMKPVAQGNAAVPAASSSAGANAAAQYELGLHYQNGPELRKGQKEAFKQFEKSAARGYAAAQYELGRCYQSGRGVRKNQTKAVEQFEKSAAQGYAAAEYELGLCYIKGHGVKTIPSAFRLAQQKAIKLFQNLADQGYAAAEYKLGLCYLRGEGVPKDESKALELFEKSANQGYAAAQHEIVLFLNQFLVP